MHYLTIWHRVLADFWPIDASRVAPNILAALVQWLGVGAVAYAVWPRMRHAVNAWMKGHHTAGLADLHAKVDHIIKHHPDIPAILQDAGTAVDTVDPAAAPVVAAVEAVVDHAAPVPPAQPHA
jgi:hypothetical protein